MPAQAPPVRDERDGLRAYLLQQQDAFRTVLIGLDDDQVGRAAAGRSALALGALVKHVTEVQRGWLEQVRAAPAAWDDPRPPQQQHADHQAAWTWTDQDTLPAALAAYDEVCAGVLDAVATTDPDTSVPAPPAPWNPADTLWSVRWVWLHLVEELARHAGHADVVRENLDGATMYELVAAREGWPATDWLVPWSPDRAQQPYGWVR